jgi:predicted ester cyclase
MYERAFDARAQLKNVLIEGDDVAVEADFSGQHIGAFGGREATGKHVRVSYCAHVDLESERIKAVRIYFPMLALLRQLESSTERT